MCTRIANTRITCVRYCVYAIQLENFKLKAARSQKVTSYLLGLKLSSAVMAILKYQTIHVLWNTLVSRSNWMRNL